jgi:SP family sugar:H+ symporter-like MFS transporter
MRFFKSRNAEHSNTSTMVPSNNNSMDLPNGSTEKGGIAAVGKVPGVTFRTVYMAMLVAMGGFIFGYDTGQISGFLQMSVFLERFGQPTAVTTSAPSGYMFTNVRSGLIVALVSCSPVRASLNANTNSCQLVLS